MSDSVLFDIQYDSMFSHENHSQNNINSMDVHNVKVMAHIDVSIFYARLHAIVNF